MDHAPPTDPFAVSSLEALNRLYEAPQPRVLAKVHPRLEATAKAFIAASPYCLLATHGPQGVHCTPRGDAAGFVAALDDHTLAMPDRRGNNRLDALRDIVACPEVALLFLVPGVGETLRVNGLARISADPALLARFPAQGKLPTTVVLVQVREVFMHCAKAMMRSVLWAGRPRPAGVPSAGELLAAHTEGLIEATSYDAAAPQRLLDTMY
jgi:PPOX class probable FMN-dependent enzyme